MPGDIVYSKDKSEIVIKDQVGKKGRPHVEKTLIPQIEFVTEDTLSNYTIYDILFPLVGKSIELPKNEFANYMKSVMDED